MKELKATQNNPQYGVLTLIMRFDGRIIYLKSSNAAQKNQMVAQLRAGGADIQESAAGWMKIDMFAQHSFVKLGNKQFDVEEITSAQVEKILADFYREKYMEAKYNVEVKDL